jgi:ACT domain-containing protein
MKRTMHKTLDRIAKLVREKKIVDKYTFCDLTEMSPSTFYNYAGFVTRRYHDIIFENGCLKAIEVVEIPQP